MQTDSTPTNADAHELRGIPGYPSYFVDDDGDVFSRKYGDLRKLKFWIGTTGYKWVALRRDGETYNRRVHHLVLEAFVGPMPEGHFGCHEDDNKLNNNVRNLRWDTRRANHDDAIRNGKTARGERSGMSRFKDHEIIKMREMYASGFTQYEIASAFGTHQGCVSSIVRGKKWKHLPLAG